MSPWWIQEVRWETTGCSVQHGRELRQLDRYLRKLACGATPKDDLFDRITTHFCIRIGVELDDLSRWRRQFSQRRVTTPNPNLLSRMERRSSVNVTHGWIVSLFSRERDGFQMESRELGRSLLRQIRDMAESYERKGDLTFGICGRRSLWRAFLEPWRRPADWLGECHCPNQNGDRYAPDISTHCASRCRCK